VGGDLDGHTLGDIAGGLGGTLFDDEATEASQINGFVSGEGHLDRIHEFFNNCLNGVFVDVGFARDFAYDFCFSHNCKCFGLQKIIMFYASEF
jgi:hypothetical protein